MESQIQRMKSSIVNIKNNLHKLQLKNQETIKPYDYDQNVLPESLIHEDATSSPQPTPKVTDSMPNVLRTQVFTPARHHLDDSQMKKALQYCCSQRELKKQKSPTIKTQYVYDGSRVLYSPPPRQEFDDYRHIIIQSKKSQPIPFESSLRVAQNSKKKKKNSKKYNFGVQTDRPEAHYQDYRDLSGRKIGSQLVKKKRKARPEQKYYVERTIEKSPPKTLKNFKSQCNLKIVKSKSPFALDFHPNTDSQFSDLDI